jgi:N utilization substance protein A
MVVIKSEFALALNQIASERGISPDDVIASIETALIAAYKKEYPEKKKEDLKAKVNKETGEAKIFDGDKDITPPGFGRIAAQTAKQVILQKIREAEKKTIISFYQSQIGSIIKGRVIRFDGFNCYLDIGKTEAILPKDEQIKNEKYQVNNTFTVYLKEIINDKFGNPRVMVSRTDPRLIEELFKREVPEIASGTVVIKKVVREPGERAKVAVYSNHRGVDSVGACVGQKGVRVQTVTNEIGGNEKIDIIQWSDDLKSFIASALSPAKIISVEVDEKKHKAKVVVEEKEAPLAIGKNGVNVNLASQLTGFEIDIIQKNIENQKEHNQTSEEKTSKSEQEK